MKYYLFASLVALFLAPWGVSSPALAATNVNTHITENTVWTASSSPYIVSGDFEIAQGVTLTIEPGVVVKFQENRGIVVHGTVEAYGTEAKPIHFTSYKDDSMGGDTNNDGTNSAPAAGDWRGMRFMEGSIGSFEHIEIRYSGSNSRNALGIPSIYNQGGSIQIAHTQITNSKNCAVGQTSGTTTIEDSSLRNHELCGVVFLGGTLEAERNSIESSLYGTFIKGAGTITLLNNTFIANDVAGDVALTNGLTFVHSDNVASEGNYNGFIIRDVVTSDVVLTADSMPYLVTSAGGSGGAGELSLPRTNNLTVSSAGSLTFEKGTILKFINEGGLFVDGVLKAQGTPQEKVHLTSIKDDSVGGDTNGDGGATVPARGDWLHLRFNPGSEGILENTSVRYAGYRYPGSVKGSSLSNVYNTGGTISIIASEIAYAHSVGVSNTNGTTTISNSSIHDNPEYGVSNNAQAPVLDARNNYWGDPSGPYHPTENPDGLGDKVYANTLFKPWKGVYCTENCYSNVLFLPGIKGSVLKKRGVLTDDTVWPPTVWSNDVSQLALDENGNSVNNIYVDGMLSTFYGTPIYDNFGSFMNSLVADEVIYDWEPLAYDWRFSPEDILEEGIETQNGTEDVIEKIEKLARESNSGRVTIVAHSMGGFMGKAIIKKLQEEGKDNLIDSFIMVGSPQLGTPQTIAAILHGHGESILVGQIVDSSASREIAQNMQSSYNLLPSARYFEEVTDPVITFNENDWYTNDWIAKWGTSLDVYSEYLEFITGQGVERTDPQISDLSRPEILQTDLVNAADAFHDEYDSYLLPSHIRFVQVAGWGQPTVKSVNYRSRHLLLPTYEPNFTIEGDSTVVYPSAISSTADETYFFNQNKRHEFEHKDLLSARPIQNVVMSVVQEKEIDITEFLTQSKPAVSDVESQLLVSSHSPVLLGVQDSEGNFTGVDPDNNPNLIISQEIPGSSFIEFGDSQYIFLPKDGSYTFSYKGTGSGSTTIEIETFEDDTRVPVVSYTDIPTNQNTQAVFEVESSSPENTQLEIDQDGDGTTDLIVSADGTAVSLDELITLLKTTISNLTIQKQTKKSLLAKVTVLEKLSTIKNQKLRAFSVHLNINILKLEIEYLRKNRKLSAEDAAMLIDILNQIKEKI